MSRYNPFLDTEAARSALYGSAGRLTRRVGTLLEAKVAGSHPIERGLDLCSRWSRQAPERILDIGCGPGSSTRRLAARFPSALVTAVDLSPALLVALHRRIPYARRAAADFHTLPIASGVADLAMVAFCLYHSRRPQAVCAEVGRALAPGAFAILATKSRASYAELDDLVAEAGIDTDARSRASLYDAFCSENAADIAAHSMEVVHVDHEEHRFRFDEPVSLAHYLATSPKYGLPPDRCAPDALAAALEPKWPAGGFTMTSRVSLILARAGHVQRKPRR